MIIGICDNEQIFIKLLSRKVLDYIKDKRLICRISLKEWWRRLPVGKFCVASRFCIVNFSYLSGSIFKWNLTIDGKSIAVPKGRRREFKNAYMLYMRDK